MSDDSNDGRELEESEMALKIDVEITSHEEVVIIQKSNTRKETKENEISQNSNEADKLEENDILQEIENAEFNPEDEAKGMTQEENEMSKTVERVILHGNSKGNKFKEKAIVHKIEKMGVIHEDEAAEINDVGNTSTVYVIVQHTNQGKKIEEKENVQENKIVSKIIEGASLLSVQKLDQNQPSTPK
ncbi:hypothetical protein ACJMK2_004045, partial [Sinanodonta woodiana]